MKASLELRRCPNHGYEAICTDLDGVGIRITDGKCCGRWDLVKSYPLTARNWRRLADEANAIAQRLEEGD